MDTEEQKYTKVRLGKVSHGVTLTPEFIKFSVFEGEKKKDDIPMEEVYGVEVYKETRVKIYLFSKGKFEQVTVAFENATEATQWKEALAPLISEKRNVLLLLNPFGGAKEADEIYEKQVSPMFRVSNVTVEVIRTTHRGHATEIGETFNYANYSVIACLSGDGLLHEVINGMLGRKDWKEACKVPIAIIPAGSGNALARSINCHNLQTAVFNVIKGQSKPLDVLAVTMKEKTIFCHLSVTHAIIADIDYESERFRFAGSSRFIISALARLLNVRHYKLKISFLEPTKEEIETHKRLKLEENEKKVNENKVGEEGEGEGEKMVEQIEESQTEASSRGIYANNVLDGVELTESRYEFGAVPNDWTILEGNFFFFSVMNFPFVSLDTCIAPYAEMDDGLFDLSYTLDTSSTQMIPLFLKDLETGEAIANDQRVKKIQGKALFFEPLSKSGILMLDGEKYDLQPIKIETKKRLLNIICPKQLPLPLIQKPN